MSKAQKSLAAKVDALEARVRAIESELTFLRGVNARPEGAEDRHYLGFGCRGCGVVWQVRGID